MMAHVENYGDVWFHPDAITNIISLKNLRNKFRVACDSQGSSTFIAHKPNGTNIHFIMRTKGRHCHDANNCLLTVGSTVESESQGCSKKQMEQAKNAQDFQAKVGHPSTQDLKSIVKSNLIVNCPAVMAEDINCAEKTRRTKCSHPKRKNNAQKPTSCCI